jgi:twitching motility protein PilI
MAKREALRELQSRLAQRLREAEGESRVASWLAVEVSGHGLLLPLASAGEIFPDAQVKPVPHTQPWFLGVANLRGGLHGVVDLAVFLGLPAGRQAGEHNLLVALNPLLGSASAVRVHRLAGLRSADQLSPEADDGMARPPFAGGRWRDAQQRVWQELDLAALSRHEQFLAIAQ